ncbi:minor tail protein [Microbacterium phage ArMaWen]|uniref:Minor tail protein n=1 Tax=Microbacterium phage ArMaWen TaxID=2500786 RepID=A0A3T0IP37_9CAUD|nr:minor tail protein [Microbacterium phage ArMaWen]
MTAAAAKKTGDKTVDKDAEKNIPVPGSGDKKPVDDKSADGGSVETKPEVEEKDGNLIVYKDEEWVKVSAANKALDDLRDELSKESTPAEESDDQRDGNDLLNDAWVALNNELDDGVAKDQVLGALTAVQSRAREVVLEHAARRKNA